VLAGFELVTLDRDRDRPADHDLRQAIPDRVTRERVARIGVGEYVGAAQQVRDRLELGAQASPLGYALVLGAVDWRLAGIARPVPADLLPRLAAARLSPRHRAELGDPDAAAGALAWATREINPTVSLLQPGNGGCSVYDYALDHLAGQDHVIPADAWDLIIDAAEDDELLEVGFQAWTAYDLPGVAERAWRLASDAGDARATSNLGALFQQRGQPAEAVAWTRKAVEAGDLEAMANLGALLHERGELAEAEHWSRTAAEAGNTLAMRNLVILLKERGDLGEAETWYRRAGDSGDTDAIQRLATLLERRGDLAEAEALYHRAARAGYNPAMNGLGLLLRRRGQLDEAETWWRRAAEAGNTAAMANLGNLLMLRGELAQADAWSRRAAEAGETSGMNILGAILVQRSQPAEAEVWFRKAARAGDPLAVNNLLGLLKVKREIGEDGLRKVVDVVWDEPTKQPPTDG
jgi:TPR repeat protein